MKNIVHHHLIYQAKVEREVVDKNNGKKLENMLIDLVDKIDMEIFIPPIVAYGKEIDDAWTGLVGITTSHISFHYWTKEKYVQMDIYSCKKYDPEFAVEYMNNFWKAKDEKALFINRQVDGEFEIKHIR